MVTCSRKAGSVGTEGSPTAWGLEVGPLRALAVPRGHYPWSKRRRPDAVPVGADGPVTCASPVLSQGGAGPLVFSEFSTKTTSFESRPVAQAPAAPSRGRGGGGDGPCVRAGDGSGGVLASCGLVCLSTRPKGSALAARGCRAFVPHPQSRPAVQASGTLTFAQRAGHRLGRDASGARGDPGASREASGPEAGSSHCRRLRRASRRCPP